MSEEQNTPTSPTKEQLQPDNASKSTQEPTQGKKPKKWLTISLMIFVLAALIIVGVLTYQNYQLKGEAISRKNVLIPSSLPTEVFSPTPTVDPTANWLTYKKENICYTFKYPKEFTLDEKLTWKIENKNIPEETLVDLFWVGPSQAKDTEFYDGISLMFSHPLEIENTSLKDYVGNKIEKIKKEETAEIIKPMEEITINGINGYTYTIQGLGIFQSIFLQSPDETCTVEITNATNDPTNQGYQKTIDKIFLTFKFVD